MKQKLLFLALFFMSFSQAQNLHEAPWYFYEFNVGGNNIPISYNEEIPVVQAVFTYGDPYLFETGACNYCGGDVVVDEVNQTMLFSLSCTLSECFNPDNTDFDNAYTNFFTVGSQELYSYNMLIIDGTPGPDEVHLYITKPNGDYIVYSDLQYYFSIAENALQNLQITPNPVT